MNAIDPDGRKIVLSRMSKNQQKIFLEQINIQASNSNLFATLYSELNASQDIYYINYNDLTNKDGQFELNENGGGYITFNNKSLAIKGSVLSEELFHAYQHDNRNNYNTGNFNREFEAKTFMTFVGLQTGGFGHLASMSEFQNKIEKYEYGDDMNPITSQMIYSKPFLEDYMKYANKFSDFNNNKYWK